jgi:hypothetical protein
MSDSNNIIFDFTSDADISNWRVVDDVVMGGRSNGQFKLNENNHGEFSGNVSLENNGGFSSLRYRFETMEVSNYENVLIRLKGDGKTYQFRVKDKSNNSYSYIISFKTTDDWETINIPLSEMYPAFRGRNLDMGNFSASSIEEIAILIGNKKEQNFKLEIDKISLQ